VAFFRNRCALLCVIHPECPRDDETEKACDGEVAGPRMIFSSDRCAAISLAVCLGSFAR
jgi:hypothetical protein